jgi:hypothetical protein
MQSGQKSRENKLIEIKRIEETHQTMVAKMFQLFYPIHHVEPHVLYITSLEETIYKQTHGAVHIPNF